MRCLLPLLLQPSLAWARRSEVPLAGVIRRENCGVRHKPRVNPVTPRTIGATATPPKLQKVPPDPAELPPCPSWGMSSHHREFPNKELTLTSKRVLCECSQPLPKLLQAEYSRPAVTFGLLHIHCTIPVYFGNYMVMDS